MRSSAMVVQAVASLPGVKAATRGAARKNARGFTAGREVSVANHHPGLSFDRRAIVQLIATLDANCATLRIAPGAVLPGELSIVFLTDQALGRLHDQFLSDPSPTDVVTFEGDAAHGFAGEICVSADAAWRQIHRTPTPPRTARGTKMSASARKDFSAELALYVVHGWLHLAGYDDLMPAKKRVMRRAEARAMALLRTYKSVPQFVYSR